MGKFLRGIKLFLFLLALQTSCLIAVETDECHCYDYCWKCLTCVSSGVTNYRPYSNSLSYGPNARVNFLDIDFETGLETLQRMNSVWNTGYDEFSKCLPTEVARTFHKSLFDICNLYEFFRVPNFKKFDKALTHPFWRQYSTEADPALAIIQFATPARRHIKYYHEYLHQTNVFGNWIEAYLNAKIASASRRVDDCEKEAKGLVYHPRGQLGPSKELAVRWLENAKKALEEEQIKYQTAKSTLSALGPSIANYFLQIHAQCKEKHFSIHTAYDQGLIQFEMGNYVDAIEDIEELLEKANMSQIETLSQEIRATLGKAYLESSLYHEAVEALTTVIDQDPENKEAYFDRALANFELGEWDSATNDYLASAFQSYKGKVTDNVAFALGFTFGVTKGLGDGSLEFIPGILSSLQGLSHGIWALGADPKGVSAAFVDGVYDCLVFIQSNAIQDTALEASMIAAPELREIVTNWNTLEDRIRGEKVGHLIGKYGVEILLTCGSIKGVQALTRLKRANGILTLEALSSTTAQESAMMAASEAWSIERVAKVKIIPIEWEKQGKHIPGHNNYTPTSNKSIFTHPDAQKLLEKYAGKGKKNWGNLGDPGFKEKIDFGEVIGYWQNKEGTEKVKTTIGIIHYSKTGAHIVPARPKPGKTLRNK